MVWMMYKSMKDLPRGILEAIEVNFTRMLLRIVSPLTRVGIVSTAMLYVVFG